MSLRLHFERPPAMPWWGLLRPKRVLQPGESLPDAEATLAAFEPQGDERYARLCGLPRDAYLPLTFPHVLGVPLQMAIAARPDFPLPTMGLVHLRNRIVQRRPIPRGQPLEVRCVLADQRLARSGLEFDLRTEVRFGGELAWESVSTGLTRAVRGSGGPRPPDPEPLERPARWVGWRVPEDLGRRYAAATGDWNPIHLHALSARLFGFKRAIIHGMWSLARSVAELDLPAGQGPVRLKSWGSLTDLFWKSVRVTEGTGSPICGPSRAPSALHATLISKTSRAQGK